MLGLASSFEAVNSATLKRRRKNFCPNRDSEMNSGLKQTQNIVWLLNWNSKTGFIYLSPSVFVCAWSSLQFWSCQLGDSEEEEEDLSKVNTRAEIDLTQLCTLASILDVIFLLQQFLKLLLPTFFTFISKTHRPAAKFWAEINHYNNYYARLLPYLMWYFFCSSLKLLLPTFFTFIFFEFWIQNS